jgi:hypothetical protein
MAQEVEKAAPELMEKREVKLHPDDQEKTESRSSIMVRSITCSSMPLKRFTENERCQPLFRDAMSKTPIHQFDLISKHRKIFTPFCIPIYP